MSGMSMMWMRMPGWGMWILMMVAMMLPSLIPMLRRLRLGRLTALVAAGYFFVPHQPASARREPSELSPSEQRYLL
jgi:hypothetical protein